MYELGYSTKVISAEKQKPILGKQTSWSKTQMNIQTEDFHHIKADQTTPSNKQFQKQLVKQTRNILQ